MILTIHIWVLVEAADMVQVEKGEMVIGIAMIRQVPQTVELLLVAEVDQATELVATASASSPITCKENRT